jgi:phytoene synthase
MDVQRAYDICDSITRYAAGNFSYGIRLLPPTKRRALSAVYAFARRIDDIGDGDLPDQVKLARLEDARQALKNLTTKVPDDRDPVLVALADAAERMALPLGAFDELIDGVTMDVRGDRFETLAELIGYCRCVAGSIGRLSLAVFEVQEEAGPKRAEELADALGIALQLTNILRDIREDLLAGRIYLPEEELRTAGVDLQTDALDFVADPDGKVLDLVRMNAARAEQWYAEGLELLPLLDRRSAACCGALAGIYHRLLQRIEDAPGQVLRGRTSLPGREKALIAVRSLAGIVT